MLSWGAPVASGGFVLDQPSTTLARIVHASSGIGPLLQAVPGPLQAAHSAVFAGASRRLPKQVSRHMRQSLF
jgi:hypothetical protein